MLRGLDNRQGFPLGDMRIFLSLEAEHLGLRNERLIKVAEGKNEPSDKWRVEQRMWDTNTVQGTVMCHVGVEVGYGY